MPGELRPCQNRCCQRPCARPRSRPRTKLAYAAVFTRSSSAAVGPVRLGLSVKCPQCSSLNTRELTRFGSTSCKALYVCNDSREPFDYFKVH